MQAADTIMPPTDVTTFGKSKYPNIKDTVPKLGTELVNCTVCFQPGYKYVNTRNNIRYMHFIHYNQSPIGVEVNRISKDGKQYMRFKYRTCTKNGRLYDSLEQIIESQQKTPKPETAIKPKIPELKTPRNETKRSRRESIITKCEQCGKDGYANMVFNKRHPNNKPQILIVHKEKDEAGHNRHYQKTSEAREAIKQLLEKYQSKPVAQSLSQSKTGKQLVLCHHCGKQGIPSRVPDKNSISYMITHEDKSKSGWPLRHYAKTLEGKESVIKALGPKKLDIKVLEQLLQRDNQNQPFIPPGKTLELCTRCHKDGYRYKTYFFHYNEGPTGRYEKSGAKKYRKCLITSIRIAPSLAEPTIEQSQTKPEKNKIVGILRRHRNEIDELIQDLNNK